MKSIQIPRPLAIKAARILEREAKSLYDSCGGWRSPWACDDCVGLTCAARKKHDEMSDLANRLKAAR